MRPRGTRVKVCFPCDRWRRRRNALKVPAVMRMQRNKCRSERRRQLLIGAASAIAAAVLPSRSRSLSAKPVRIIVPVAPGAATDLLGRMAADWLGKRTGSTVIVENRTGAGGNVALEQVA